MLVGAGRVPAPRCSKPCKSHGPHLSPPMGVFMVHVWSLLEIIWCAVVRADFLTHVHIHTHKHACTHTLTSCPLLRAKGLEEKMPNCA